MRILLLLSLGLAACGSVETHADDTAQPPSSPSVLAEPRDRGSDTPHGATRDLRGDLSGEVPGDLPDDTGGDLEAPAPRLGDLRGFHFVLQLDEPYVVLRQLDGAHRRPSWTTLTGTIGDAGTAIREDSPPEAADPESAQRIGSSFALYDESGVACVARVRQIAALHRGSTQDGLGDDSAEERAASLLDREDTLSFLVARLDVQSGDCAGAFWARPTSMNLPLVFAEDEPHDSASASDPVEPFAAPFVERLKALPEFATVQSRYVREVSADASAGSAPEEVTPFWSEYDGYREVRALSDAATGERIVVAQWTAGGLCGEFYGDLWAAFHVSPDGHVGPPRAIAVDDGPPRSVVDVDDDGYLDLVGPDSLWVGTADGFVRVELPSNDFVCPC